MIYVIIIVGSAFVAFLDVAGIVDHNAFFFFMGFVLSTIVFVYELRIKDPS